ncbi:DUF2848 domain-containing protein [Rhodoligotrophos defluvii]|uniref:DUF2848 domain-containing protein n=1 Tax=Rhodoligotrophos defluvii TaxID=2561934 RepID=UPI0010C9F316|nr:DUF2848 domain-containing protein [Rhodoligotrophos defluvii]
MTYQVNFVVHGRQAREQRSIAIREAVIAGWTGRDKAALEKHIAELEALGVPRPTSTPIYYRVAAARITTAPLLEAVGTASSGEVEFVMLRDRGELLVGIGSDHTDRKVETYDITVSKQMCDKPMGQDLWRYDDVRDHWDSLMLRSWIWIDGERVLYQEGPVSGMLSPEELLGGYGGATGDGTVMFCGTHAAMDGIRPAARFECELQDPRLGRSLRHAYDVKILPIIA